MGAGRDAGHHAARRGGARALSEGLEAIDRERLLYGAALAGWALGVAGTALHHRICHILGGAYDLPHAETHSAVLPQVTALNAPAVPDAARLGLGRNPGAAIFDLARHAGAPTALRELGLREEALDAVVPAVVEEAAGNPVPVDEQTLASSCAEPGRAFDRMASRDARTPTAGRSRRRERLTTCRQRVGRRRAIATLLLRTLRRHPLAAEHAHRCRSGRGTPGRHRALTR